MKLRMAKNSMFAILLRSPWWISFAVAAVLTLAALAILPRQYATYAAPAGFPFIVIGVIAFVRQSRVPSRTQVARMEETVRNMSWKEFADTIERSFRQRGYEVVRLQRAGADFEVTRGHERGLVYCKRWKAASHGVDSLRELSVAAEQREARERIYIALNPLSESALRHARENRIDVIQDAALTQMLAPVLPRQER